MGSVGLRPMTYRHVVFPDASGSSSVLNFAPARAGQSPHPPAPDSPNLSVKEESVLRWLFEQAGLEFNAYRGETLKRRIPACLRATRMESLWHLRLAVQRNPQLLQLVMSTLLIGITSFFRDPQVYVALAEQVLPELYRRLSGVRIWSAGCSDGSELYSIAMLLAQKKVLHRCSLLGTDCRADAICSAREGKFDPAAVKGVPAAFLARYFSYESCHWRVHGCLQTAMQWRTADLLSVHEPGTWDLILCRNLAIYMHNAAAGKLWRHLQERLRPGGYLVLGKAERPLGAKRLMACGPCIYRRESS